MLKLPLVEIVVMAFIPLLLRTALYLVVCRMRSIHITLLSALIIGCAGALISFVPLPLPSFLRQPIVIAAAMFLFARYTEAEIFPDVLFIPLGVELLSGILVENVVVPILG